MSNKPNYQKLFEFAESQAGYFTSAQAVKAGYSWERLSSLTKNGKFKRINRGLYRISLFPSSRFEDLFIALLNSGTNAVLSHESALIVYDLSDAMPGEIHVTFPRTCSRRRKGIQYHTKKISQDEITTYQGMRVTIISRMIIDLIESGYDPDQIKKAIEQAIQRGMMTKTELIQYVEQKKPGFLSRIDTFLMSSNP